MRSGLPLLAAVALSCGNGPPSILPVDAKTATVGVALEFDVSAVDPDGDDLIFSLTDPPAGATVTKVGRAEAKFRWVPGPNQLEVAVLNLAVTDGTLSDTEAVPVTVKPGEASGKPEFTSPTAYVFNLASTSSVRFDIAVKDDSSPSITFQEVVKIDRARLKPLGQPTAAKKATFSWEPTVEQRATPNWIYVVKAVNDFGIEAEHRINILLRGGGGGTTTGCTGEPPEIAVDDAGDLVDGDGNYLVNATITDTSTILKVVLRWAEGESPSAVSFLEEPMTGDEASWSGAIPAPELGPGETKTLTYQVCALDDDGSASHDPDGDDPCDHYACGETKSFLATPRAGLCHACTGDAQCAAGALCVTGFGGEQFCGRAVGAGCPMGYVARTPPGKSVQQCVPYACGTSSFNVAGCSCLGPMPGEMVINELMPTPKDAQNNILDVNGDGSASASQDEYVELVNTSDRVLTLTGLKLYDAQGEVLAFGSQRISPGRAALVFGGGDPTKFKAFANATVLVAGQSRGLALNDSGTEIVRLHDGRTDVDRVTYLAATPLREALARATDGAAARALSPHSTLALSGGSRLSPGAQQCGSPFPQTDYPCGARTCAQVDTDAEPNDDRASASCLADEVQGHLAFKIRSECPAATDPVDSYSFQGTAGKLLYAATRPSTSVIDIYDTKLTLYGPTGARIAQGDDCASCAAGAPDEFYSTIQAPLASTGTYYLTVEMGDAADCSGGYILSAELR